MYARLIRMTLMAIAVTVPLTIAASAVSTGSAPVPTTPTTAIPTTSTAPTTSTTGPTTTTTAIPASTTTTAPSMTTTTTTRPIDRRNSDVVRLQQRLADLGYDVGTVDGMLGSRTYFAVMAFQKMEGLDRTGEPTADVLEALEDASPPAPLVPDGEPTRIEIDLERQVLLSWRNGRLARILPSSTGNGERYCTDDGDCGVAVTPPGKFRIGRTYPGTEVGPLGPLHYPMYFNGGIAIHGSPNVPAYPDSHGCARIPMYAAASFFHEVAPGTAVYVVG
jgi:peptidoglycan hydrolase-like protein with peptidoglycan-binding domain